MSVHDEGLPRVWTCWPFLFFPLPVLRPDDAVRSFTSCGCARWLHGRCAHGGAAWSTAAQGVRVSGHARRDGERVAQRQPQRQQRQTTSRRARLSVTSPCRASPAAHGRVQTGSVRASCRREVAVWTCENAGQRIAAVLDGHVRQHDRSTNTTHSPAGAWVRTKQRECENGHLYGRLISLRLAVGSRCSIPCARCCASAAGATITHEIFKPDLVRPLRCTDCMRYDAMRVAATQWMAAHDSLPSALTVTAICRPSRRCPCRLQSSLLSAGRTRLLLPLLLPPMLRARSSRIAFNHLAWRSSASSSALVHQSFSLFPAFNCLTHLQHISLRHRKRLSVTSMLMRVTQKQN